MKHPEPLSCPWCGGKHPMAEGTSITHAKARCAIFCSHCHRRGPWVYKVRSKPNTHASMRKRAVRAWNNLTAPVWTRIVGRPADAIILDDYE